MKDLTKYLSSEQANKAFWYVTAMNQYYEGNMTLNEAEFYADILWIFFN